MNRPRSINLTLKDCPRLRAQELLGHQDIRTTKRFYRKGEKVRPLK